MKILIKESQYHLFVEQGMSGWGQGLTPKQTNDTVKGWSKGNHNVNTILAIGTAFIPIIGPFLSAGIGLMDAAQYYQEGSKTEAGVAAFFSLLPGLGKVVQKIPGITQLGQKGMAALGSKIVNKQALTKVEQEIINFIGINIDLVRNEANNSIKSMAAKGLNKVGNNPTTKKIVNSAATTGLQYGATKTATSLSAG
jgi:hypothetical protein